MKNIAVMVLSFLLVSCGTFSTTFTDDKYTQNKLVKKESYCKTLPRVYSGVSYDFCKLHAQPVSSNRTSFGKTGSYIPFIAIDLILSGVLDTIVLPYTVFEQVKKGSLEVE